MIEAEEKALVEKLVAHAPVETLAEAILHRLSRRNEMPDDPVVVRPGEHGVRGELGPVVGHDHAWLAAPLNQDRQFPRHAPARDRGVRDRRQALPGHVIDDVQDAESSAAGELVMDEIHRPASIRLGFDQDRRPRPCRAPPSRSLAHREALFAIEPVDAVDARGLALLPQQDEQPTISETLPLVGEVAQLCPKLRVWRPA
jgi:hypothetical protein